MGIGPPSSSATGSSPSVSSKFRQQSGISRRKKDLQPRNAIKKVLIHKIYASVMHIYKFQFQKETKEIVDALEVYNKLETK